jgi:nicotinamidase-related amidase
MRTSRLTGPPRSGGTKRDSFLMSEPASIEPSKSALLIMDYQPEIVGRIANSEELLQGAATVLAAARGASLSVIYVAVGFRPGYPEVSERNAMFQAAKAAGRLPAKWPIIEVHPAVEPKANEPIVVKHRVGAFFGTGLEMLLRAKNIENLVLCGVATSGVVLSTVRHASDADYRLTVIGDCCADPDAEVHRCLLEKVFPKQASVIGSAEFGQRLV